MLPLLQKNILIVPLAAFIRFNKRMAGERIANLFGKYFDDLLALEEELQEHEKFCAEKLDKLLFSNIVADFNLGKKNKQEFISEALKLLKLPSDKAHDFESAWSSLLTFDKKLLDEFSELIKLTQQGKSIYFIGNTNELHAQKVLDLFKDNLDEMLTLVENVPEPVAFLPLKITQPSPASSDNNILKPPTGNLYFCLSYFYQTSIEKFSGSLTRFFFPQSSSGLLKQLLTDLTTQNKNKEAILLINPYEKANPLTKKLAVETISKDLFFKELRNPVSGSVLSLSSLLSIESSGEPKEPIPTPTHH